MNFQGWRVGAQCCSGKQLLPGLQLLPGSGGVLRLRHLAQRRQGLPHLLHGGWTAWWWLCQRGAWHRRPGQGERASTCVRSASGGIFVSTSSTNTKDICSGNPRQHWIPRPPHVHLYQWNNGDAQGSCDQTCSLHSGKVRYTRDYQVNP